MRKAVFDTTTLVSALLTPKGVSAQLLKHAVAGAFELWLSDDILAETRDVLFNREHLRLNFTYTNRDVAEFCLLLKTFARIAVDLPSLQVSRDPEDDYVLATALAADASYLVTRDKDLLTLKTYQTVEMIHPEEFIALLRQQVSTP
jgi:putative PIN family toxin of toxin-antitoxin system